MRLYWLMFLTFSLQGQVLSLSSAGKAKRGGETKMVLTLDAGKTKPTALQWEVIVPVKWAILEANKVGPAAQSAGKALQCGGNLVKEGQVSTYRCILAGGLQVIGNGEVAELSLRMRNQAGDFKISIERAMGVSTDLKTVTFKNAESKINVR
jgi:hypothetical protein